MIVTFDATILVRASKRSDGPARKVVDALAANPEHVMALSSYILGEVGKVLSYPRMQALFRLTSDDIHDYVAFLRAVSRIVEPARGMPVVLSDPADDPVVYTAVAAGADVLCVKDRDFYDPNVVRFCASQDIRIMDDVALLELLRHADL
ncbi:MAG TPA: putative toxin-antitoxin system toxin component, PIN family [Bryobacteraceae bacterium]|jgi:putative PIN family toxin of toxin-antitoxin system|nr:putative toxin-antitoxin system toxin component, PIN family [Bryobacteraceae bacterium]